MFEFIKIVILKGILLRWNLHCTFTVEMTALRQLFCSVYIHCHFLPSVLVVQPI